MQRICLNLLYSWENICDLQKWRQKCGFPCYFCIYHWKSYEYKNWAEYIQIREICCIFSCFLHIRTPKYAKFLCFVSHLWRICTMLLKANKIWYCYHAFSLIRDQKSPQNDWFLRFRAIFTTFSCSSFYSIRYKVYFLFKSTYAPYQNSCIPLLLEFNFCPIDMLYSN